METLTSADQPWLSVVMPTHCGERWVGEALGSLSQQGLTGIECIVIDSSPDRETLDIATKFTSRLDLRLESRTDLQQWTSKTNYGVELARAPFFSILHQDDRWLPDRAAFLRKWISADPVAVMHIHPSIVIDEKGRRLGLWRCPLSARGGPVESESLFERLLVQNFISIPAPAIRRDVFRSLGGLKEDLWYTADWDCYLNISRSGSVVYHAEPLTCFRIHKSSLTMSGSRSIAEFEDQMMRVLNSHLSKLASGRKCAVLPKALASIAVNTALAAASNGDRMGAFRAIRRILQLGPSAATEYLRESRLVERVLPRVRARILGAL